MLYRCDHLHSRLQTLRTLTIDFNRLHAEGVEFLADALKVNKVRCESYDYQILFDHFHQRSQTLQTLNLYGNDVGAHGAKYLADALEVNRVRCTSWFGHLM